MRPGPQKIWLARVAARRGGVGKGRQNTSTPPPPLPSLFCHLVVIYHITQPRLKLRLIRKTPAAVPLVALNKNSSMSMAGVQVMPAVGAVTTVDVRAEGGKAAALRKRRVGAASGSGGVSSTSLFVGDWRRRPRRPACSIRLRQCRSRSKRGLGIVSNLGGQYEDGFEDVHVQLMNFFTFKAVRTVLNQLYEMNPPSYRWFHNFIAVNKPTDGKLFLRALGKERHELAERVMITRLHLYGKWIKKCDHAMMYEKISDENLALMRERLMETVIWPTDDTNTEKIG